MIGSRQVAARVMKKWIAAYFRRTVATSLFISEAWLLSSWLAAADCSLVAELVCTTLEIWSMPSVETVKKSL